MSPTLVSIVEDDPEAKSRLEASIASQSWLALDTAYATGSEALLGLADHAPDVLLVDLGLPDMSGLEVIRWVAKRHPACDILVVTIFGDESHVMAALEAGARGYLLKGSLTHDIALDIRDVREGGSPLSPGIARQLLARFMPAEGEAGARDTTLSPREREILRTIAKGFSYAETARLLGITVGTVHTHLKRVYRKLAVNSKTEAVFEAGRLGLLRS